MKKKNPKSKIPKSEFPNLQLKEFTNEEVAYLIKEFFRRGIQIAEICQKQDNMEIDLSRLDSAVDSGIKNVLKFKAEFFMSLIQQKKAPVKGV